MSARDLRAMSLAQLEELAAALTEEWRHGKLTGARCRLALRVTGEATRRLAIVDSLALSAELAELRVRLRQIADRDSYQNAKAVGEIERLIEKFSVYGDRR